MLMSKSGDRDTAGQHRQLCAFCSGIFLATLCMIFLMIHGNYKAHSLWVSTIRDGEAAATLSSPQDVACGWQTPRILEPSRNPLWEYFQAYAKGPVLHKWHQYFDIYHRYLSKFRTQHNVTFLEIGIQSGGTIGMWQHYFGDTMTMYGVDINPYCKELFEDPPRVNIFIGDQSSRKFWAEMRAQNVSFDVILDDGGHTMSMQIATFEEAWPMLKSSGIYICEDTSTSMDWITADGGSAAGFGGGYKRAGTWLEYSKDFADIVNGHYIDKGAHVGFDPLNRRSEIISAAFYDQMVVLEKGSHPAPVATRHGNFAIDYKSQTGTGVDPIVTAAYRNQLADALAA